MFNKDDFIDLSSKLSQPLISLMLNKPLISPINSSPYPLPSLLSPLKPLQAIGSTIP